MDPTKVNEFQRAVARTYGDGEFADIADVEDMADLKERLLGIEDHTFAGMMHALSTEAGCASWDRAKEIVTAEREQAERALAVADVALQSLEAAERESAPTP